MAIRTNWTRAEIEAVYNQPLLELIFQAASIHREYHNPREVQQSTLLSIKTGGCSEDCAYCPQAARYNTGLEAQALMQVETVVEAAKLAKAEGSSRFCMGAAWREVRDNAHFDRVIEMVQEVNKLGMEVCCTLGMLNEHQAQRLKDAGLYAYNHNLDTSEENYGDIITTRTYDDRKNTLDAARKVGLTLCCGGIVGLGEEEADRIGLLQQLSTMEPHPESVPINKLVAVKGTPLENQEDLPIWEFVRVIATARILMPASAVRLSAGRANMSIADQALCFMAGANSIFAGDKLLTTPNPEFNSDKFMFDVLGLQAKQITETVESHC